MEREIEFRAWHKSLKEMLPNIQNHLGNNEWAFGNLLKSDSVEIMQFTGLRDKNGVKVFEGDMVLDELTKATYEVKFGFCKNRAFTGIYVVSINVDGLEMALNNDSDSDRNSQIIVIGNVFQNPELLKP